MASHPKPPDMNLKYLGLLAVVVSVPTVFAATSLLRHLSASSVAEDRTSPDYLAEPEFKQKIQTLEPGGVVHQRFEAKKREYAQNDDPRLVGFSPERMLWDERWARFETWQQKHPVLNYAAFLWEETQALDPEITPERFKRNTSLAKTFEEYKYETDPNFRRQQDQLD